MRTLDQELFDNTTYIYELEQYSQSIRDYKNREALPEPDEETLRNFYTRN